MAKLRRSLTPHQGLAPLDAPRRRVPLRRLVIAGLFVLGVLALAWIDGGEKPLRPIAEPVDLSEQPQ